MGKIYRADPQIEVTGSAAKAMVDNISTSDIQALVAKHGLEDIQLEGWIKVHKLCNLFNDVAENQGGDGSQVFIAMGMKIAEQSEYPPEMLANLTMSTMIMGWNDHYQHNHRGGKLPDILSKKISDTEYEIHMPGEAHPYPYNMTYGIVYSSCRRLLPKGTKSLLTYVDGYSPYDHWEDGVILKIQWGS